MYRIGRLVLKNLGLKNIPLPSINNNFLRKMRVPYGPPYISPMTIGPENWFLAKWFFPLNIELAIDERKYP